MQVLVGFTCIVNRVLSNSRGYVSKVELTPAQAPATSDGGKGILGDSPGAELKFFLTVSYANNCRFTPSEHTG